MDGAVAVVLAAGRSTRMKWVLPKVLHEVSGRPLIDFVLDAVNAAGVSRTVVIVGHESDRVRQALSGRPGVEFALQAEQKGTGHAVMMCREALANHRGAVLVLMGDAPLIRPESLSGLMTDLTGNQAACVIGTAVTDNNFGFGRIVRDPQGRFLRIVEQKDATPEEAAIREINVGCYAFDGPSLFSALDRIQPVNQQGEYYLTDVCEVLRRDGKTVLAANRLTITEALGVNTRAQLVDVHRVLHQRHCEQLMAEGVTLVDPQQVSIDLRATIGADTVIYPFTAILGPAVIGQHCRIGPHAVIESGTIPDGTRVAAFERRT
jgi:bifunctional UDP-N-acetylglucosamine pyrophosphorylase/glucosamine-1-phosphate N-acetyltransferase